ncbi:MAG: pyruvate kinase [Defluviitaleaceae bacterium]|nr:pyruvate kinase [Defluviitaleaceae bacterium]
MGLINEKSVDIIFTMNNYNLTHKTEKTICDVQNLSCDAIRFNLSKINELEAIDLIFDKYHELKKRNLMFDFPIPQSKFRIFFCGKDVLKVKNKKVYSLRFIAHDGLTDFYCDANKSLISLKPGQSIICGDGEGMFTVVDVCDGIYWLEANNNFMLINGKALHLNALILSCKENALIKKYEQFLSKHKPYMAAFSFVDSVNQINLTKQLMNVSSTLFVSKIETCESVRQLNDIIDHSDLVMIGRGDLGIYMNFSDLYFAQNKIIKQAKLREKAVYVATDILESLCENVVIPNRADIIDITHLLVSNIDGLILSAGIKNCEKVITLIRRIEDKCSEKSSYD